MTLLFVFFREIDFMKKPNKNSKLLQAHQENLAIDNDPLKKYASGYEDFLQSPLQVLFKNNIFNGFFNMRGKYQSGKMHK